MQFQKLFKEVSRVFCVKCVSRKFKYFNEVLFCNFFLTWISSQLPEQKEGLFFKKRKQPLEGPQNIFKYFDKTELKGKSFVSHVVAKARSFDQQKKVWIKLHTLAVLWSLCCMLLRLLFISIQDLCTVNTQNNSYILHIYSTILNYNKIKLL